MRNFVDVVAAIAAIPQSSAMDMNREVFQEGWLIKSPPTKRIWRAVSHILFKIILTAEGSECVCGRIFVHIVFVLHSSFLILLINLPFIIHD